MSVKAFELVPAIERLKLMSDKAKTQIQCVECCGKNLYIGTDDCFVIHYVLEERTLPNGRIAFFSEKQGHKYLALKKPVMQLKAASALNRILVLCDATVSLLNMFDMEPILTGAKIKGVTYFCLNENPVKSNPFSVEICVALKKKCLQIITVTEDKLVPLREIPQVEVPLTMCIDGFFICTALTSGYNITNYNTGTTQDLFPFDSDQTTPLVLRISREEFLLSAPSALGMFASSSGISQRPPLQWSDNLLSVQYSHPYILALNDEFITVHSILDQQQKQSIPFQGGQCLGEFDGRLFVATGKDVYCLIPVAIEKQIQALLADRRVSEALELAKNARKTGLSKEKFQKMYHRIQQQAAFIEFAACRFEEAHDLFKSSEVDLRELISLYPHMLPASSDFTRHVPPLHEIADITQLSRNDQSVLQQYKEFLLAFLEEVRHTSMASECTKEVDTVLLKLYAEGCSPELEAHVIAATCEVSDCVKWLEEYDRHHALALLYRHHGDNDKALQVWTQIVDGTIVDNQFPGLNFIADFLCNLEDHELIWKHMDWLMEKDEELGVRVFIERPEGEAQTEKMREDVVIDYLSRYPSAIITYLQHLVFTKKLQKEQYHTHLAVLYLDRVLQRLQQPDCPKQKIDSARSQLRHMLQTSNLYRVQLLLGKVTETEMHAESAILYGKLEEHDKALRILVHKLRDYGAAQNYCYVNAKGRDDAYRHRLFHLLLAVYLDPNSERRDALVAPAINLLNNNRNDFDSLKVLQLLPEDWSLGLLSGFLTSSVRGSLNSTRTCHLHRMLARGEHLQLKEQSLQMLHNSVVLTDDRVCAVCNHSFTEPSFVRYPNGVLTHVQCAKNKHVCPITGKYFGTAVD